MKTRKRTPVVILLALLLAALAVPAGSSPLQSAAERGRALSFGLLALLDAQLDQQQQAFTPTLEPTSSPTPSETPVPTATSTPTPIPLLEWIGPPTYPGDSVPGILFRMEYDPSVWTLNDQAGTLTLIHLRIEGCVMDQAAGRGLPPVWKIERRQGLAGPVPYEISTASLNGVAMFTNYLGGDQRIYTGFQVRYTADMEACLRDAEAVLATLHSVTTAELTATPTPTATRTPTLTPTATDTVAPTLTPTATP